MFVGGLLSKVFTCFNALRNRPTRAVTAVRISASEALKGYTTTIPDVSTKTSTKGVTRFQEIDGELYATGHGFVLKRFGEGDWRESRPRCVQLRNPRDGSYILIDREKGSIVEHSYTGPFPKILELC